MTFALAHPHAFYLALAWPTGGGHANVGRRIPLSSNPLRLFDSLKNVLWNRFW